MFIAGILSHYIHNTYLRGWHGALYIYAGLSLAAPMTGWHASSTCQCYDTNHVYG